MNASRLEIDMRTEEIIGTEDRVFYARLPAGKQIGSGWYWQCRGYDHAYGPFDSRDDAVRDWDATITDRK